MKSFLETLFFLIKNNEEYNKELSNGFLQSYYYDVILSNAFLSIVLGSLIVCGIFYILLGRINFKFANIYIWLGHLAFSGIISVCLVLFFILSAYSQGQGVTYYDFYLLDFEYTILWSSGVYSMVLFFIFSMVFKTRFFTIYSRNIPF